MSEDDLRATPSHIFVISVHSQNMLTMWYQFHFMVSLLFAYKMTRFWGEFWNSVFFNRTVSMSYPIGAVLQCLFSNKICFDKFLSLQIPVDSRDCLEQNILICIAHRIECESDRLRSGRSPSSFLKILPDSSRLHHNISRLLMTQKYFFYARGYFETFQDFSRLLWDSVIRE